MRGDREKKGTGEQRAPAIPRARKNRMKKRVPSTSPESQAHLEESTAEMPSSMKMTVSAQLASVFIVYLTAVRDLWEMLASTYFLHPRPHMVTLGEGQSAGEGGSRRLSSSAASGSDAHHGVSDSPSQSSRMYEDY